MSLIDFDVMDSLGIPNIPGFSPSVTDAIIEFGGGLIINKLFGNYWGIFDQHGFPILLVDSMTSIEYERSSSVMSAPIEKGSFASYNKVLNPREVTVQLVKGSGGVTERALFMAILEAEAGSTNRFIIITPEAIYPNHTIESYDYSRQAGAGARLIKANIKLKEIRQVSSEYYENKETYEDTSASKNDEAKNPKVGGQKKSPQVSKGTTLSSALDTTASTVSKSVDILTTVTGK